MATNKTNSPKLQVSDEFIEIYRNFSIKSQSDNISRLSRRDRLLLLIICFDTHRNTKYCLDNYRPYEEDLRLIHKLLDEEETTDPDLIDLGNLTGEVCIDVKVVVDKDGNPLPSIYTEQEIVILRREEAIKDIIDNNIK